MTDYLNNSRYPYASLRVADPENPTLGWAITVTIMTGSTEIHAYPGGQRIGSALYHLGGTWTNADDQSLAIVSLATEKARCWEGVMVGYRSGLLP